jgi:hypothetical protein
MEFFAYQRQMQRRFMAMQRRYGFEIINANRSPRTIAQELSAKIGDLLGLESTGGEPILAAP